MTSGGRKRSTYSGMPAKGDPMRMLPCKDRASTYKGNSWIFCPHVSDVSALMKWATPCPDCTFEQNFSWLATCRELMCHQAFMHLRIRSHGSI